MHAYLKFNETKKQQLILVYALILLLNHTHLLRANFYTSFVYNTHNFTLKI